MDELCHWNELPAQVDAILSEVWIKLDVDKRLQQAQEKIDEINNGHSEIGEIFNNVEQGLIDIDNELHPTNSDGERISYYADIADTLANIKSDMQDLHLKIEDLETCPGTCTCNTSDGQNSEEGNVFLLSDDSVSPPLSPKVPSDKEEESMDTTSNDAEKLEPTVSQQQSTEEQVELSEGCSKGESSKSVKSVSSSSSTQAASQDVLVPITVQESRKLKDAVSPSTPESFASVPPSPIRSRDSVESIAKHVKQIEKSTAKAPSKRFAQVTLQQSGMSVKSEPGCKLSSSVTMAGKTDPHDEPEVIDLCDGDDSVTMEDDQDEGMKHLQTKTAKTHVQDSAVHLTQGSRVLAKNRNNVWEDGTITSIIKDTKSQQKYKVMFDRKSRALVSGKHIALMSYPMPSKVHVGSRVVAESGAGTKSSRGLHYEGIVAEVPLHFNKARYLIFFDNGHAQYLNLNNLHLVYEASDNVWEDVPVDSREFIQEYLEKYPERPMVRLHRGQGIKTEWKGVWWRAKVVEVDGSLVNMNFPSDNRNEWIYRGSPRLEPLHRELETARYLRESGRLVAGSSVSKKRGGPCVEYQRVNPDFLVPERDILALAEGKPLITKTEVHVATQSSQAKSVLTVRNVEQMPVVEWAVTTLRKWCESQNISPNFEVQSNNKLAALLERVYREGPVEKPDVFTPHTLNGLRCALSTFLTEPPISRKVDIYKDAEFVKANKAFTDSMKEQVKVSTKRVMGSLQVQGINRRDLVKLLRSGLVSLSNPLGLLRLVWFFMQPFIGRAKGKVKSLDLDLLQKKDVMSKVATSGLPYYEINSPVLGLSGGQEQRIYATGNRFYCPYHAISSFKSKLHPDCPDFLQQPRTKINFKLEKVWFDPKPMSSTAINSLMSDIGSAAKLTRSYTNADIRATPWDNLQEAIEDFSESLRMGYRKNPPPQAPTISATTTSTTTITAVGKHVGLPAVIGRTNKPISQQPTVRPSNQHCSANSAARQLQFQQTPVTKQPTAKADSDDDVIIIETSTPETSKNHAGTLAAASQRLVQMSNMYRADRRQEKQQTAKKSTSKHHHSHHRHHDKKHRHISYMIGMSPHDRLKAKVHPSPRHLLQPATESRPIKKIFVAHECKWQCVAAFIPDDERKKKIKMQNPLRVPDMYGWMRRLAKQRGTGRRHVVYRAPCGRSLRNIAEVFRYLTETKMEDICVDAFTFDPFVYTKLRQYRITQRPFLKIHDLSNGAEPVPVSLVNEIDMEQPPDVKYIAHRQPERGSKIIMDTNFLVCCDCTDNCMDNAKCVCRKLTQKTAEDFPEVNKNTKDIGYKYRRLNSMVTTGIYECNSKCACKKQCHNRVAQNGLSLRLQVFKTDKRGWGLRCLDDIPQGAFVCTYAGQLWGAEEANRRGQEYGDEYFAELDHIEVVENNKEGYESDPMEDEGISDSKESVSSDSSNSDQCLTSDDDYHADSDESHVSSIAVDVDVDVENQSEDSSDLAKVQSGDSPATKMVFRRQQFESGSGSVVEGSCWSVAFPDKDSSQSKVEAWVNSNLSANSNNGTAAEDSGMDEAAVKPDSHDLLDGKMQRRGQADSLADSTDRSSRDCGSDFDYKPLAKKSLGSKREQVAVKRSVRRDSSNKETDSSTSSIIKYGYNTSPGKVLDKSQVEAFRRRSHTSRLHMRKKAKEPSEETKAASVLSDGESSDSECSSSADKGVKNENKSIMACKSQNSQPLPATNTSTISKDAGIGKETEKKVPLIRTRSFFGETSGHVMDAKFIGNLGRYLNHSCSPNLFVQNVFVDSHDLRFPWVAFFAKKYVRAGSELTWDYNYDVGSVPGKSLICLCGSHECRGRLL